MKFSHHICRLFLPAVLGATPFGLTAQTTTATVPARPPTAPGIMQAPNTGFALGGPVGVLTEQQRASYDTALNSVRSQMADLQAKLRAARQDFLVTSLDQKFNEDVLRQKALAAARIEAEMAVLRAKAMSQVQPPLSAEQIAKIKAGQPGPIQPLRRQQLERAQPQAPTSGTNQDANGLPPKK